MSTQAFLNYRNTMSDRIKDARPEELVVMLYEGILTRLKQAKERFEVGQAVQARESMIKAMQIVDALMENLNMEQGGETAQNLEKLYYFLVAEMANASRSENPIPFLDNTIRIVEPLYEGWKGLGVKS